MTTCTSMRGPGHGFRHLTARGPNQAPDFVRAPTLARPADRPRRAGDDGGQKLQCGFHFGLWRNCPPLPTTAPVEDRI